MWWQNNPTKLLGLLTVFSDQAKLQSALCLQCRVQVYCNVWLCLLLQTIHGPCWRQSTTNLSFSSSKFQVGGRTALFLGEAAKPLTPDCFSLSTCLNSFQLCQHVIITQYTTFTLVENKHFKHLNWADRLNTMHFHTSIRRQAHIHILQGSSTFFRPSSLQLRWSRDYCTIYIL